MPCVGLVIGAVAFARVIVGVKDAMVCKLLAAIGSVPSFVGVPDNPIFEKAMLLIPIVLPKVAPEAISAVINKYLVVLIGNDCVKPVKDMVPPVATTARLVPS